MARGTATDGRKHQRRTYHQGVGRDQLLDAGENVFGRKGFHRTTLKEIAELAEFSVGSVYSFFENKDDLFRQIFVRRGDDFMTEMNAVLDDIRADPVRQLHDLVDFEVGFFRRHPHFGRLYLRYSSATMPSTEREIDIAVRPRYEEAMRLQAALIERGQRAGHFRLGDPDVMARIFSGIISAYQSLDPAVVSDDERTKARERYPLKQLHEVVESAFARPKPKRRRGT